MPINQSLITGVHQCDFKSIARAISIVENNSIQALELLKKLSVNNSIPIIGVTGAPGAGKSTLVNAMIAHLLKQNKKIAVLAVDPSSPFNLGALLGDRIRISDHFDNENLYIRSIATRGSLGGLSNSILETADVVRSAGFDFVFVETVGVGQSEVEVAGMADTTIVVMVPEGGDEVQTMKAGIMEIANVFVVNKADRPGSDSMIKNLSAMVHEKEGVVKIFPTIATQNKGIEELINHLSALQSNEKNKALKSQLMARKAFRIIQSLRMKDINFEQLSQLIEQEMVKPGFNLYQMLSKFTS